MAASPLSALLLLGLLVACGGSGSGSSSSGSSSAELIAGTTTRIGEPGTTQQSTNRYIGILNNTRRCLGVLREGERDLPLCLPHVDRASGEVRLSFHFTLSDNTTVPTTLDESQLRVTHALGEDKEAKGFPVADSTTNNTSLDLVPHDEIPANQLYILMIDGSASMKEEVRPGVSRMDEVRSALLSKDVQRAFFPDDRLHTAVALFQFTEGRPQPLSGQLTLLEEKRDYAAFVQRHLQVGRGFTYLYDAVTYATSDLLAADGEIWKWLKLKDATPTVVVLTDGFNNQAGGDLCETNARRLENTLKKLRQNVQTNDINLTPTVYTVGLGRKIRPDYQYRNGTALSAQELCGTALLSRRIDGDLERVGIDNVSLEWLARFGGGAAYISSNSKGLGDAFQAAAARRYRWFEVRYRVDPGNLRRSFRTTLALDSLEGIRSSVVFYPSAWLDAPPGVALSDSWTRPASYRATLALILPVVGALLMLSYMGAAWFNVSRVLFGRMRPPRPPR